MFFGDIGRIGWPGQFNLVLPGDTGTYASPAVDLLGIAIDTRLHPQDPQRLQHLQPLAARLHHDPVITSVLKAVWCSAQADVCLPGFLSATLLPCRLSGCAVLPATVALTGASARARPPAM